MCEERSRRRGAVVGGLPLAARCRERGEGLKSSVGLEEA